MGCRDNLLGCKMSHEFFARNSTDMKTKRIIKNLEHVPPRDMDRWLLEASLQNRTMPAMERKATEDKTTVDRDGLGQNSVVGAEK